MEIVNITSAIIDLLSKLRRPLDSDEIAFRIRSTPTRVSEQLHKLEDENVVKKENKGYVLTEQIKSSFSFSGSVFSS